MIIGKWSEVNLVRVVHLELRTRSGEAIEMSGEEVVPLGGALVGVFSFKVV